MKTSLFICAVTGLAMAFSATATAKEVGRQQIAQWASTGEAPKTRTQCIDREAGKRAAGDNWKLCTEWRTEVQVLRYRTFLVANALNKLSKAHAKAAKACLREATATAQLTNAEDGSALALPAATDTFERCIARQNVQNPAAVTLQIDERSDWTGWN